MNPNEIKTLYLDKANDSKYNKFIKEIEELLND